MITFSIFPIATIGYIFIATNRDLITKQKHLKGLSQIISLIR